MNLTTNDLLIVIGEQTLEIKMLRLQLQAAQEQLKAPPENVVKMERADGTG